MQAACRLLVGVCFVVGLINGNHPSALRFDNAVEKKSFSTNMREKEREIVRQNII